MGWLGGRGFVVVPLGSRGLSQPLAGGAGEAAFSRSLLGPGKDWELAGGNRPESPRTPAGEMGKCCQGRAHHKGTETIVETRGCS